MSETVDTDEVMKIYDGMSGAHRWEFISLGFKRRLQWSSNGPRPQEIWPGLFTYSSISENELPRLDWDEPRRYSCSANVEMTPLGCAVAKMIRLSLSPRSVLSRLTSGHRSMLTKDAVEPCYDDRWQHEARMSDLRDICSFGLVDVAFSQADEAYHMRPTELGKKVRKLIAAYPSPIV